MRSGLLRTDLEAVVACSQRETYLEVFPEKGLTAGETALS